MNDSPRHHASDNVNSRNLTLLPRELEEDRNVDLARVLEQTQTGWEQAVEAYLNAALDSFHTRRAYRRHLLRAGQVLATGSVEELTGADLAAYRGYVISSALSASSKAQALAAVRSFLGWATDLGGGGPTRATIRAALKTPRGERVGRYTVLNEVEIASLFRAASKTRDVAILGVLLGAGLRVAEAAKLDLRDVVEDSDGRFVLTVRSGKGAKDRIVPVGDEVAEAVREYVTDSGRYLTDAGPLFLAEDRGSSTREGRGISTRALSFVVKALALRAGVTAKRVSPHSLRHSYAIRSLRAGGNVVAVSKLLGHSTIATTQRYVDHLALGELRASVPTLPMSDPRNGPDNSQA